VTHTFTLPVRVCYSAGMPRMSRKAPGGLVYHVLNRASGRLRLFRKDQDYLAFEKVLAEAHERAPIRILGWCLLPDHWHLVLWPKRDRELSDFMRWLSLTHAQRWKHAHDAVGRGHLYQDRFKSFPIQQDHHLLTVLRYVERNVVRPTLARRAEKWPWGSAFVRQNRSHELRPLLAKWPVHRPANWLKLLNTPVSDAERKVVQEHIERSRPMGDEAWVKRTARALGAEQSLRPRGRPPGWRKHKPRGSAG
jgi:putative transposase